MRLLPESARSQRFLAVTLLLIALLLVYLLCVHWWLISPYLAMREQYYDLKDQQYHFAELIQSKPVIERQLKDVAGLEQENQAFLNDADATSAFSDLSERVKHAVEEYRDPNGRCTISGISPISIHAPEVYLRVSANVNLSCQAETFSKVLYALEASNPYLFVDRLVMFRQPMPGTGGKAAAPAATLVNAQFMLSGFLRQPGNAKGDK
ncbi:MAG: type II secretion system protein GspM [Rudaea sp.]|uniref:type II secretion system protein GspM n=1 Tax=Rudaea sp. TaxID=2136325 RepID=UPI0039E5F936